MELIVYLQKKLHKIWMDLINSPRDWVQLKVHAAISPDGGCYPFWPHC